MSVLKGTHSEAVCSSFYATPPNNIIMKVFAMQRAQSCLHECYATTWILLFPISREKPSSVKRRGLWLRVTRLCCLRLSYEHGHHVVFIPCVTKDACNMTWLHCGHVVFINTTFRGNCYWRGTKPLILNFWTVATIVPIHMQMVLVAIPFPPLSLSFSSFVSFYFLGLPFPLFTHHKNLLAEISA